MTRPKVFLTGGDEIGWAIDEDLRLTREAVANLADLVTPDACDVVHSVWWEGLMMIPPEELKAKRIVCHVPGEPFRYLSLPEHRPAVELVGRWVTRTAQAAAQLRSVGILSESIPYLVDATTFRPLSRQHESVRALRTEWNLPENAYLIGSFQRDTEGSDLVSPKRVKGPDVLLAILSGVAQLGLPIHVVLAGPRRHWLRERLTEVGIPFTYVGRAVDGDDLGLNSLPRSTLNILYNVLDLYVVASRSEGGPHAVLEAAASGCKIISTPVGTARDLLDPVCIYTCPSEAVDLVQKDMVEDSLGFTRGLHRERVHEKHVPAAAEPLFAGLYASLGSVPPFQGFPSRNKSFSRVVGTEKARGSSVEESMKRSLTVGLWHSFFKPPYGGGNQFMMALRKGLVQHSVRVRENELTHDIDAYILNSIHFDVDRFLKFQREHRINVIHRIDGPIHLIRGFDREKDELCYSLNEQFASATVLQSAWTYQRIVEMGYKPVRPVIVHNAVDPDIFHSRGRIRFERNRKVRLISTSWSNNPRKGGPTYKWLDTNLDWDRYEYTFVGNASEEFSRIRHIPPVSSEELAALLRNHDVYITASRNDPCSNALIEALACGLPALYLNDGGHPELVGMGGLPFHDEHDILSQLRRLVDDYEIFQSVIVVPALKDVAGTYLALVRDVIQ